MSPRNNNIEQKALKLVLDAGDDGLIQSDMWKCLDVSSREGSRLAIKFEEKGVIERRKVLHEGRWTYKLFSKVKPVTIDAIIDCPCVACDEINRCVPGGSLSPLDCRLLTDWIETNTINPQSSS